MKWFIIRRSRSCSRISFLRIRWIHLLLLWWATTQKWTPWAWWWTRSSRPRWWCRTSAITCKITSSAGNSTGKTEETEATTTKTTRTEATRRITKTAATITIEISTTTTISTETEGVDIRITGIKEADLGRIGVGITTTKIRCKIEGGKVISNVQ